MRLKKRWDKTLLWLKPQFLGDAVMALPLLDELIEASSTVFVRANSQVLSLLEDRRIVPVLAQKFKGIRSLFRVAEEIKALQCDACYLVDRSFRSALTVRIAGLPVRVGHSTERRRLLLTHAVPYSQMGSEIQCGLDLVAQQWDPDRNRIPTLDLSKAELESYPVRLRNVIAYQPGARYVAKQYPIEKMAKAARLLGRPALIVGGPDEAEASEAFIQLLGHLPNENWVGKTSLRGSMAVLRQADLCIGSDTGLLHIAAALGTPTLTLFGPNPPTKWAHHYDPHRFLEWTRWDIGNIEVAEVVQTAKNQLERV